MQGSEKFDDKKQKSDRDAEPCGTCRLKNVLKGFVTRLIDSSVFVSVTSSTACKCKKKNISWSGARALLTNPEMFSALKKLTKSGPDPGAGAVSPTAGPAVGSPSQVL